MLEIYLLFYQGVLPVFTTFNKYLQREEPLIYLLSEAQERFMNKLAGRFIKPEVIQEIRNEEKSFAKLDISLQNQKDDIDLGIGILTKRKVKQLLENGYISQEAFDKFFDGARVFFSKAYQYCVMWLPPEDSLLQNCKFFDFDLRSTSLFDSVQRTVESFDTINRQLIERPELLDTLEEKFMEYQTILKGDIPQHIQDEAFVKDTSQSDHYRMDMVWGYLRQRSPLRTEIALAILVVPHSNAANERVFSMIRKNKTKFRSRLDLSKSLNFVMRVKMSLPEQIQPCYRWKPDKELLKKCRSACKEYNRAHSSKDAE